jgi:hypothetical protein
VNSVSAWLRSTGVVGLLALTAACSDGQRASEAATTDPRSRVTIEGRDDGQDWSLTLTPQEEGFCLGMSIEPGITEPIVLGRAVNFAAPSGDSCIGQDLDADGRSVSFEPVFAPFILQGQGYLRAAIGGAISKEAEALMLELSTGELLEASIRQEGLFAEFPPAAIAALHYRIGDEQWRCEIEQNTEPAMAFNRLKTCQPID